MDAETLTNHIRGLGKQKFEIACKIILRDVFGLNAINVDGRGDGGTDFSVFSHEGTASRIAYQITTQKTDIERKAYRDAQKAIDSIGATHFYFLSNYNLTETQAKKMEHDISTELHISATCLSPKNMASLLIENNVLNKFLDEANYPLPKGAIFAPSYREMAVHAYTILSNDASRMRSSIYDDTMLFVLSNTSPLDDDTLVLQTREFLGLDESRTDILKQRIGTLFGNNKLKRTKDKLIEMDYESVNDIDARKKIYEQELNSLSSAQTDLMWTEYHCEWSQEDSKKVAIWIASITIAEQINNLKEIKASIASNPLFEIHDNGMDKLKDFLTTEKKIDRSLIDKIIQELLDIAASQPLITKIARSSVYLALEGANPIASAKALGVNRWSDINILIEPSVAIPYICSQLYTGSEDREFNLCVQGVRRAIELDASPSIPYFYVKECAGHILLARKYCDIQFNEDEMIFSQNAFIAHYFSLKQRGIRVPNTLIEYLSTYSPNIRVCRDDNQQWTRAVMTDVQSILNRAGITIVEVPFYDANSYKEVEIELSNCMQNRQINRPYSLLKHDVLALKFVSDSVIKDGSHWVILTRDNLLIAFARSAISQGWITNPKNFLNVSEVSKPLSESRRISLVHSFATFSEKTLAAGARIIDKVVSYASIEMQNGEFKQDFENFKRNVIETTDFNLSNYNDLIDIRTDEFLKKRGLSCDENEDITDTSVDL